MSRRVLYAGSFDPPTMGHLDLIERARRDFGEVVVGVGMNATKRPMFSVEERMGFLRDHTSHMDGVSVGSFEGLAVDYARQEGCAMLLRGLRTTSDFEAELTMALTNRRLAPEIDTVFLAPSERFLYLSSRLVKEVVRNGGRIDEFLPPSIAALLEERLKKY